ncbi:transposase IS66 (plasmid) [Cylindrospermum sp. NIES-4074]|nr:transposase IS66 [Cylindrospermum sp. NIES-4074]BAZ29693.1 transposase IS66 [Cylindrospermum sp. NIES-4074]BAZ30838.1 transposase IS66 [Cylindrospermum sp. NIES-4074]BAZ31964.1 transposase IS66 [Cylindrospermum sp. NIES-4074]BAZ33693.1 transposase IS66 [Cylindrospermum sp. NIES-4074]
MQKDLPPKLESETLRQLATEQLVEMIIEQANAIVQLKSKVIELQQEIEKLKVSRDLDSTTSSKPPSGDILKKPENKQEDKPEESEAAKRKPGGQPGHPGKTRKGFGRVDRFEILRPQMCSCCGQREFRAEPIKIETQQVAQLVERPIEIVEYQRYTCICSECGETQTAEWSPEMVPGQDIGIRLQAFLGWINNYGHLSYEKQQELLWELGEIEIGVGTLVATNERIDGAVAQSIDLLKEWIKQTQPNIHSDETPWVVKGVKEWLWIFANTDFALFHAADTRSRAELESLLGSSYEGVLSSDDYSAYNGYPVKAQQKCLAHLRRHFKKLIKLPGLNNQEIGAKFINLIDEAFKNYALFQQTQNIVEFLSWTSEFKTKVESSIKIWIDKAGGEASKLLRSLRNKAHQWWYFLDHPEIPPDNNLAERTLRLAVTKRKVSGGSRSMERFQDTANLLTVIQTCRRQGRSVIEFFEQAIKAIVNTAVQTPSLIPPV